MVPITDSYRKTEKAIDETTNTTLSHEKIRQVVLNVGDKITSKDGIYQKDQFHIMQEIVRDVPKEYRNIISELVKTKHLTGYQQQ